MDFGCLLSPTSLCHTEVTRWLKEKNVHQITLWVSVIRIQWWIKSSRGKRPDGWWRRVDVEWGPCRKRLVTDKWTLMALNGQGKNLMLCGRSLFATHMPVVVRRQQWEQTVRHNSFSYQFNSLSRSFVRNWPMVMHYTSSSLRFTYRYVRSSSLRAFLLESTIYIFMSRGASFLPFHKREFSLKFR